MTKARQERFKANGRNIRGLLRLTGFVLVVASVVRELRLPRAERTWHGVAFNRVPYDLRPPTFERLKGAFWSPENPDIVVPTAFGVGWTVNVAALCSKCYASRGMSL